MRISLLLTGFAVMALGACTTAVSTNVSRLGSSPVLSGGSYSTGGGITVAADMQQRDGMIVVCGVWAQSQQQSVLTKHVESKILSSGSIFLGGKRVVQDLKFMNEVAPADDYSGLAANCVKTASFWPSGGLSQTAQIRIPRQVVVNDLDGEGGGGIIVYFRQTGPSAQKNSFRLSEYVKDKISN